MVKALKEDDGLKSAFENHPDILEQMGRAIAVWGAISHLLRELTTRILNCSPENADSLLSGLPGEDKRLRLLIDLLDGDDDAETEKLRRVLKHLKTLTEERNLVVHGAPVHGGKVGVRPRSHYFVNFRKRDDANRYVDARVLLKKHLEKLRRRGGELFDILYPDDEFAFLAGHTG
ncbi:hypothetical protein [Mesorhizobium sp. AA22]|uniref:hypothetical protein n=1 Tax=Mesorhizobium sp. AA22 TaxID=1854057 RepID=UPI0007ED9BD9|nr:hypothetical protein [Mesorhizobium sp. AA22]QIA21498.1 hypothetical protein A9K68_006535 [Mesorhizobium sp. AA22]